MGKPLTTKNAEVVTAKVELKTLSVSGKQVSMAVFRQIPHAWLINEDGSLAGLPWGRVNYFWDGGKPQPARQHVLWQMGADLFRCILTVSDFNFVPYSHLTVDKRSSKMKDGSLVHEIVGFTVHHSISHLVNPDARFKLFRLDERVDAEAQLKKIVDRENDRLQAQKDAMKAILDLPQIFIAV